jgi:hypothetical protein
MKRTLFLVIGLFFLLISNVAFAQCDQAFLDACSNQPDAKYIKHFRIRFTEASNTKTQSEGQFTIMLNKGSHYRFTTCNDPTKPGVTIIELASDVAKFGGNSSGGTDYKAFDFLCTKTGPYYLKMYFRDGKEGCGVCVISIVTD